MFRTAAAPTGVDRLRQATTPCGLPFTPWGVPTPTVVLTIGRPCALVSFPSAIQHGGRLERYVARDDGPQCAHFTHRSGGHRSLTSPFLGVKGEKILRPFDMALSCTVQRHDWTRWGLGATVTPANPPQVPWIPERRWDGAASCAHRPTPCRPPRGVPFYDDSRLKSSIPFRVRWVSRIRTMRTAAITSTRIPMMTMVRAAPTLANSPPTAIPPTR